jgi:putative transposase
MSALVYERTASCVGRPATAPQAQQSVRVSVSAACQTLELARATYYRHQLQVAQAIDPDVDLRDRIQHLAVEWPSYGYRRMTAALQREGVIVNRKRVLRLMREDNLLCLRKQRFKIVTTDSGHGLPIYPNLAKDFVPDAPDQLWVADITYIRLAREFVYLAVVLDAFSRRVLGWELSRRIDTALTLSALRMAISDRKPTAGRLIHHSDRGVQYASKDYIDLLGEHGTTVSMSRRATPQDNAFAESFMKTLKYEEVYMTEYDNLADARRQIGHFLEEVYNQKRLHSALGYLPPAEFERQIAERNQIAVTP